MLWDLIKAAIRDIELNNEISFGNETWNRLKQLEKEIYKWQHEDNPVTENHRIYHAMTDHQKTLLKAARDMNGASILDHKYDEIREARELENLGYVTLEHAERSRHMYVYIAIKGRLILKENGV